MAKNKNKNRIKYDIRDGKLATKGKVNKDIMTPEQREYATYKALAKKAGLPKWEVFSPTRYRTVIAGDKARGWPGTPVNIAKRQGQEGLTDSELTARFEAVKKLSPKKYLNLEDFRRKKGWEDIDDEVHKLRLANPGMLSSDFALLITRTIYSPPME